MLLNQKKEGLGRAYLRGFKYGIENGAYALCEMDADMSHDPKYLPEICKLIEQYDFVVASRYVKGGGVVNWNLWRKFVSGGGNLYSKLILGVGINDLTGGYNMLPLYLIWSGRLGNNPVSLTDLIAHLRIAR